MTRNFNEVVEMLMRFRGLEELVFLEDGDRFFVEELRRNEVVDGDGVAVLNTRVESGERRRYGLVKKRVRLNMEHVFDLEVGLRKHPAVKNAGWKIPRFRYIVVDRGVVVWEGKLAQSRKDALLLQKMRGEV